MHLISAVFVPIIDFDNELCQTRIDVVLRTSLQLPCFDNGSGITANSSCTVLEANAFKLVNMSLSISSAGSEVHVRRHFLFGAETSVLAYLSGSVTLIDKGSEHHVRVFSAQSSHSHVLQWCGSAAMRVAVRAELHSSSLAGEHTQMYPIQTGDFVVVYVPEENCVVLGEQECYDVGSEAGCFWCQRAQRCLHSSRSASDAASKCNSLPKHVPPSPLIDQYSSIQCIGGIQNWPLVSPLSNRNRICMMRNVCIADGQLTLYFAPSSSFSTVDESQLSIHSTRGITHYDGWSSLKSGIHSNYDATYPDGDSSGFVPRVEKRTRHHLALF